VVAEGWDVKLARRAKWWRNAKTGRDRIDVALILARNADDMLAEAVAQARAEGQSWAAIGEALGVTRQTAWERFGGAS
jgi:hypothetical protein